MSLSNVTICLTSYKRFDLLVKSEMDANAKYLEHGFRAASLLRGYVKHIGGFNSTSKFK